MSKKNPYLTKTLNLGFLRINKVNKYVAKGWEIVGQHPLKHGRGTIFTLRKPNPKYKGPAVTSTIPTEDAR